MKQNALLSLALPALVSTGDFLQIRTNIALSSLDLSALISTGSDDLVVVLNGELSITDTSVDVPVDVELEGFPPARGVPALKTEDPTERIRQKSDDVRPNATNSSEHKCPSGTYNNTADSSCEQCVDAAWVWTILIAAGLAFSVLAVSLGTLALRKLRQSQGRGEDGGGGLAARHAARGTGLFWGRVATTS